MTRRDTLHCIHEPFGDAYYYGPERLNPRYEDDEAGRDASGFAGTTYQDVLDGIDRESAEVGLPLPHLPMPCAAACVCFCPRVSNSILDAAAAAAAAAASRFLFPGITLRVALDKSQSHLSRSSPRLHAAARHP